MIILKSGLVHRLFLLLIVVLASIGVFYFEAVSTRFLMLMLALNAAIYMGIHVADNHVAGNKTECPPVPDIAALEKQLAAQSYTCFKSPWYGLQKRAKSGQKLIMFCSQACSPDFPVVGFYRLQNGKWHKL